jgi:hypothetical protein
MPRQLHFAVKNPNAAAELFVGLSDDRRFIVPVLVLFVFFVLVIIAVGVSRRHRVAHDGDEAQVDLIHAFGAHCQNRTFR